MDTTSHHKARKVIALVLSLLVFVGILSGCDVFAHRRPPNYAHTTWICEQPHIVIAVYEAPTYEDYILEETDCKAEKIRSGWGYGGELTYYDVETDEVLLEGNCSFSSNRLTVYITKDIMFKGKYAYKTIEFTRFDGDYDPNEYTVCPNIRTQGNVNIRDSIYAVKERFKGNILLDQYSLVVLEAPEGYYFAGIDKDGRTIRAVVKFSKDLELLEANGVEPIEQLNQEEWIGKEELEFVSRYGSCHFNLGSGLYIPSYISKTGLIYSLYIDDGVISYISTFSPKDQRTITLK